MPPDHPHKQNACQRVGGCHLESGGEFDADGGYAERGASLSVSVGYI